MLALVAVWPAPAAPVDVKGTGTAALAQVPADAVIVIQIRGVERTKGRLLTMVKNALPDLGPKIQDMLEEKSKEFLMGRQLKGLAKEGPLFAVMFKMPQREAAAANSGAAFVAAVTNFADFRDGLLKEDERKSLKPDKAGYETATIDGETTYFIDRNGYAVITPDKEVAEKFLKKQPGLDTKLNKEAAQKLLASDVSAYVDMTAVNKEFGPQIKQFRPLIKFFIQQASAQSGQQMAKMYEGFFDGAFQLLEDSRLFLAAAEFRLEGLALTLQDQVGTNTKVNAFLKGAKPGSLAKLGTLTAGQLGYMGAEFQPEYFKAYGALLGGFGNQSQEASAAWDELAAAGPQTWLMDYNMPTQGLQVWTYKDPAKAVKAQLKLFQAFKTGESYQSLPLKEKPEIKTDAETFRGFKLNSVRMAWDFEKLAEKTPQGGKAMADAMKALMGDTMNTWFGTDGKVFVVVTAKDWPAAQKILAAYLDGKDRVGKAKAFQEAMRNLPAETNLLVLMDVPQYVRVMAKIFEPMFKAQGVPFAIPELKAPKGTSLTGFTLTLRPEVASFDLWVPVTSVSEIKKMAEQAGSGSKIQ